MDSTPPFQTPTVSTASTAALPADITEQVSNGATNPCLLSYKTLPDGTIRSRTDEIYENTWFTQTPITAQLISSLPPGSNASDPRRPYIRTLPLGYKYAFFVGPTDAGGDSVTIEHHSSRLGSVPVTRWTNGVLETLPLPARQTIIRYCRHSKAETNLGTQDLPKQEETLDGIKKEGKGTSPSMSNTGVKEEEKDVKVKVEQDL